MKQSNKHVTPPMLMAQTRPWHSTPPISKTGLHDDGTSTTKISRSLELACRELSVQEPLHGRLDCVAVAFGSVAVLYGGNQGRVSHHWFETGQHVLGLGETMWMDSSPLALSRGARWHLVAPPQVAAGSGQRASFVSCPAGDGACLVDASEDGSQMRIHRLTFC